ncbi:AmmeMemoRadiSam system protein B, partial [Dolichospermum sp. ST_sed4]|nr:AmmeMemoRadiSam system protein B [Dolichospermum sp. ST_sed4]
NVLLDEIVIPYRYIMIIYPTVAGKFYPADPEILRQDILTMLLGASAKAKLPTPKAIIAPHAGLIYSGPIAASAYAALASAKNEIHRVVLLAPAHHYPVNGIAKTKATTYVTPLGKIPIDQKALAEIDLPYIQNIEAAFEHEHAIEVHLPFLQLILEKFSIIPLLVGFVTPTQVATLLEKLWGDSATLVVISSDLSHYYNYATAKILDNNTATSIKKLEPNEIASECACGGVAIQGLLIVAANKKMRVTQVDLRNSGDTQGTKN